MDLIITILLDDDLAEFFRRLQRRLGQNCKLAIRAFDTTGRNLGILLTHRIFNVLCGEPVSSKPCPVEPDAHGIETLTENHDLRDTRLVLHLVFDDAIKIVGDVELRHAVRQEGDEHNRLCIRLDLGNHRLVDLVGQKPAHTTHAVTNIAGRHIGVRFQREAGRHLALLGARSGRQNFNAFDARDRFLKRLRDFAFDHRSTRTTITRGDRDHGFVNGGIFAHSQALIRHRTDKQQDQSNNSGKNRTPDKQLGNMHAIPQPS